MANSYDKVKIHEALELLDAAAAEEQADLKAMVGDGYDSFKAFAANLGAGVRRDVSGAYNAGKDKVRAAAHQVDGHVHAHPWAYVGGGAALGLLIGLLIARSRR